MIKPLQVRAARALLDWSENDLADAAAVPIPAIEQFERGQQEIAPASLQAIDLALQTAGVVFIHENGDVGVSLRRIPGDRIAIAETIGRLEEHAALLDVAGPPSPDRAMKTMRRAVAKNDIRKLKNKLAGAGARKR